MTVLLLSLPPHSCLLEAPLKHLQIQASADLNFCCSSSEMHESITACSSFLICSVWLLSVIAVYTLGLSFLSDSHTEHTTPAISLSFLSPSLCFLCPSFACLFIVHRVCLSCFHSSMYIAAVYKKRLAMPGINGLQRLCCPIHPGHSCCKVGFAQTRNVSHVSISIEHHHMTAALRSRFRDVWFVLCIIEYVVG